MSSALFAIGLHLAAVASFRPLAAQYKILGFSLFSFFHSVSMLTLFAQLLSYVLVLVWIFRNLSRKVDLFGRMTPKFGLLIQV